MAIFCLIFLSLVLGLTNLPVRLASLTSPLHYWCDSHFSTSQNSELLSAFLCGSDLLVPRTYETFRRLGLIHLIVVSGSHLIWLEFFIRSLCRRVRFGHWLTAFVLMMFMFAARLDAPVLRAGLSLGFSRASRRWSLGWTGLHCALYAGMFCLALFPLWMGSLSLLLSWAAALVLASRAKGESMLWTQCRLYAVLFLCLLPLAPPHPLTIFMNLLLAPIVVGVLFPIGIAIFAWPASATYLDPIVSALTSVLDRLAEEIPDSMQSSQLVRGALWIYLGWLQVSWLKNQIQARQA
jgi:predicted membrane metal-binding protein